MHIMWRLRAGAGDAELTAARHPATWPPGHASAHSLGRARPSAVPLFCARVHVKHFHAALCPARHLGHWRRTQRQVQRPLSAMGVLRPGGPVAARLCFLVVCSVGILCCVSDAAAVPPAPAVAAAPCSNGEPRVNFPCRERAINSPFFSATCATNFPYIVKDVSTLCKVS